MIPKFRGKSTADENNGEWVYGNLIVDGRQASIVNGIIESTEQYISIGAWCPVDAETVGQSTGLKDKNGVEIFEGDVIKQEMLIPTSGIEEITGVVKMLEGAWMIVNDKEEIACHLWREGAEMKILGNIYENQELVEDDA
ncbi:YopX family protein [Streptococcus intermedius]|uniref:YopX family protein n=1 Tax=Streptococcus intermedius TaxID=1338 RepID=UPI002000772A|nr:YopX family protein [Streptococcus intermedius]